MTDDETLEQSFNIAWRVLRQSGDMGDENEAAGFLLNRIEGMMQRGEKRRLLLSNRAIDGYRLRYQLLRLVS